MVLAEEEEEEEEGKLIRTEHSECKRAKEFEGHRGE
jgi:hypothetical protein